MITKYQVVYFLRVGFAEDEGRACWQVEVDHCCGGFGRDGNGFGGKVLAGCQAVEAAKARSITIQYEFPCSRCGRDPVISEGLVGMKVEYEEIGCACKNEYFVAVVGNE